MEKKLKRLKHLKWFIKYCDQQMELLERLREDSFKEIDKLEEELNESTTGSSSSS